MFEESLRQELELNGISLTEDAVRRLCAYQTVLSAAAAHMNLTAIKEDDASARLNFADSLLPMELFRGKRFIDVGTGAGFPGIPLAIALGTDAALLDATRKKAEFLRDAAEAAGIKADIINMRAEEAAHLPEHRGKYDIAAARAVASARVLCELLLPFVRTGGQAILYKGPKARDELKEAKNALAILGGEISDIKEYTLSGEEKRCIVIINKVRPCPARYPRRPGMPANNPL